MSKSSPIAEHDDALGIYFNDMLHDPSPIEPVANVLQSDVKPTIATEQNSPFQALLFDINGLQLAIRTQDVKAILPWPDTPLSHSSELSKPNDAILGIYSQASYQTKVINTAHIVLPPQHQHAIASPSFIILIGQGEWALSCHKINAVTILSPTDIKWRKHAGTRPWLAGTSIEKNCSIINITELVKGLTN